MEFLNILLIVFSFIAMAAVLINAYSAPALFSENTDSFSLSDRSLKIIVLAAAVCALAVRIYKFGSIPGGFNQDGAMAAVDANALLHYGTDRFGMKLPVHFTAWGFAQMSVLMSYCSVPFIKLLGLTPIAARMSTLIVSLAGLVCLYLFMRDTMGKTAAAITLAFAAINPWHIMQSRWALDANFLPHVFTIGLFLLNRGLMRKNIVYTYISMFFLGMCMYCYGIAVYTVPVFMLGAGIYACVKKRVTIPQLTISALIYTAVSMPLVLTMVINTFKLDTVTTPFFTMPYFPYSVRSRDILFFAENIPEQLVSNIKSMCDAVILQYDGLNWNCIKGFGTVYMFSLPFALIGIYECIHRIRSSCGFALILIGTASGIWSGLITASVNINRINIIFYFIIILCAIGLFSVFAHIRFSSYIALGAYAVVFCLFCSTYFTSYAEEISYTFFAPFGNALTAAKKYDADRFYITPYLRGSPSPYACNILTMFYHDIDARYFQGYTPEGEIPFKEKYIYTTMDNVDINKYEHAVYVITAEEKQYFDEDDFVFEDFGDYLTVCSKLFK